MSYLISKYFSDETPHYFYKTINLLNGRFYYGSSGPKEKDYFGSSKELIIDIKKYGKHNFKCIPLRYFRTREDAFNFEFKFLRFIDAKNLKMCYNLSNFTRYSPIGMVSVIDNEGNNFCVSTDDPRYLSGELISSVTGTLKVRDITGKIITVSKNDPRYLSGEFKHISTDRIVARDKDGNILQVTREEFETRNDLYGHAKGKVVVKDINGNTTQMCINDPRYLSGEFIHICKGQVTVRDKDNNTFNVDNNDPRYLSGELVSIATGLITIKDEYGKFIKVDRNDPRKKNAIYPTTGLWNWNKFIIFENKKVKVQELAKQFGVKCSKVKEYLDNNSLIYKENLNE